MTSTSIATAAVREIVMIACARKLRVLAMAVAAFGVYGLVAAPGAQAAMVLPAANAAPDSGLAGAASISSVSLQATSTALITSLLYNGTTLFTGVNFAQFELNLPAAGNLQVRLQDLEFPALAGALSFALVNAGSVIAVQNGSGDFEVDIGGPAKLFAFVYAVGAPGIGIGSYHLNIQHEYEQPVPLPAGVWLLLSGAAWFGWLGRGTRASHAVPEVGA